VALARCLLAAEELENRLNGFPIAVKARPPR